MGYDGFSSCYLLTVFIKFIAATASSVLITDGTRKRERRAAESGAHRYTLFLSPHQKMKSSSSKKKYIIIQKIKLIINNKKKKIEIEIQINTNT